MRKQYKAIFETKVVFKKKRIDLRGYLYINDYTLDGARSIALRSLGNIYYCSEHNEEGLPVLETPTDNGDIDLQQLEVTAGPELIDLFEVYFVEKQKRDT